MNEPGPSHDRQQEIIAAVLKVVGVALAIGLAIGVITWAVVRQLDLGNVSTSSSGVGPIEPVTPLPTTALPLPTPTDTPSSPDTSATPQYIGAGPTNPTATPGSTALFLNASPVVVRTMDRINLTGDWPGHDSISLLVQQLQGGQWVDFGVQTEVQIGTFETYVETSHVGNVKFRVFDPSSGAASNAVTVSVS
ncbi:MAG: hypothetical protein JWQ32_1864 [Marmoricola sp.]|nr:hypothetical protein [Marmoricola sp.]